VVRVFRCSRLLSCLLAAAVASVLLPGVAQAAGPANTALPTISGTTQQGQTLTLTQGTWTDATAVTVTDAWEDCTGATCTANGDTGTTYALTATDVGKTIEVQETATATDGTTTVTSAATATVIALAPVNSALPTITGTAQQGQTLTAGTGTWTNTPTSYAYQWESCSGTTCTAISGATGSTYAVAATDVGKTIEVEVTAGNSGGSSAPAASAPTTAVIALAPVNSALPTITGTAQQGQTLTAGTGTWTNTPTSYAYQWEGCSGTTCTAISGATGSTYAVAATDVGKTIEVAVTATNTGGSAVATSAPTAVVVPPAPTETSAPSITGTFVEGDVLTEQHGTWTNSPTSYTYEWLRCDSTGANCVAIAGATAQTYTLAAADVGARLLVLETATNAGGSGTAYSALSPVITTPALVVPVPVSSALPTVSGVLEQGQTLVESHGTWSGNPGTFDYQWERCGGAGCTAVPGAVNQTYTLTAADVGQDIAVLETAANSGGAGAAAASVRTAAVIASSAITLAVAPSTAVTNQTVTLAATVTSGSGNADPAGSVTFSNGSVPIGGCTNQNLSASSQSVATICQASFGAGPQQLAVSYQPGGGSLVGAATSAVQTLVVGKNSTSISLAVTKQVAVHKRATYVATVVPPAGNSGPTEPTGSIGFFDHGRPIAGCRSRPLQMAAATCLVKYATVGSHRISAKYQGDANFEGSTSPVRSVLAGKNATGPVVLGFISSTLQWKFYYTPNYTQVLLLEAYGVPNASDLRLICRGGGCPFATVHSLAADAASCSGHAGHICSTGSAINLLPSFRKGHLRAGTQIILRITRPNWVGKYYSFTIRGGQPPLIDLSCLAVGRTRPGVGC
jgi:Bacterial Ig-like domain (group 3)